MRKVTGDERQQKHADPPDEPEDRPRPLCYIVSPNTLQAQLLAAYLESALAVKSVCTSRLPLRTVIDEAAVRPCVYLLDCLNSDSTAIEKQLGIGPAPVPDPIMIALYNIDSDDSLTPLVKRYRIRGIFCQENSQSTFTTGMQTILDGHLWLTRQMLSDCILLPNETRDETSVIEVKSLTRREKEILHHVAAGRSNQEIADALEISLYTVKTHLYNIYKKINVPNRMQAALWAATYLRDHWQD